jgi:hypothetical protein
MLELFFREVTPEPVEPYGEARFHDVSIRRARTVNE